MMSVRFLVLSLIGRCDSLRALSPLGIGLERYTAPPRTLQPRLAPLLPTPTPRHASAVCCSAPRRLSPKLSRALGLVRNSSWSVVTPCATGSDGELDAECLSLCDEEGCSLLMGMGIARAIRLGVLFALWFGLSTGYNIQNKMRLNALSLPWLQSLVSLGTGNLFVGFLWLTRLRKAPTVSASTIRSLLPIAFWHASGHVAAVISASAGAVSFTQIVKEAHTSPPPNHPSTISPSPITPQSPLHHPSPPTPNHLVITLHSHPLQAAEPVFTAGLGVLLLNSSISLPSALSLLPIVCGVALASVTELSFTWAAFSTAMLSNFAFAMRNIFSRSSMQMETPTGLSPQNLFGVLSCLSTLFLLPIALLIEGPSAAAAWAAAAEKASAAQLIGLSVQTGLYFYLYNEVAMIVLNTVHPVTHAVANTLKRVVILLACVVFFQTPMSALCAGGSAIAIAGSAIYSLSKRRDARLQKAKAE